MFKLFLFLIAIVWVTHSSAIDVVSTLELLASDDYEQRTDARNQLRLGFAQAEGENYEAFQNTVLEFAQGTLPIEERLYLLKLIGLFGTEGSVAPVAAMLTDKDAKVRDSARRALSNIPSDSASRGLALGLQNAAEEDKHLFLDALAYRKETRAVAVIAAELGNPKLSSRAALALGKIGSTDAIPYLLDAIKSGVEDILSFELALLKIGLDAELNRKLVKRGSNDSVCVAAFRQLSQQDPKGAEEELTRLLKDPSARARSMIISEVWSLDVPELEVCLVHHLASADVRDKVLIITGVGESGSSEYENDLLDLFPLEEDPMLKQTMYETLGTIGGDSSFELLLDAFKADGNNREIGDSLARLQAPSADAKAMQQALSAETLEEQISAIRILELRNVDGSTELMNTIAKSNQDAKLRKAAFKAMESIGNHDSIQVLVDLILTRDALLRSAQLSLKRMCLEFSAPEFFWEHYFQPALSKAESDEQRIGLIQILDCVEGPGSIGYIQELILDSDNEAIKNATVKTLSRWPSTGSVDVWMQLLKADASYRAEAIRAIHRAVKSESVKDSPSEKVDALVRAVGSTENAKFKNDLLRVYLDPPDEIISSIKSGLMVLTEDPDVSDLAQEIIDELND